MTYKQHATYEYHEIGTNAKIRHLFETHRNYLLNDTETRKHVVGDDARPFFYNLFGYLIFKGINAKLHWVILMLSGLDSPEDFDDTVNELIFPNIGRVEEILALSDL